jgi:hypothetical protein
MTKKSTPRTARHTKSEDNSPASARITGKRTIKALEGQQPTDRIIVSPFSSYKGGRTGEYAILKLNFTEQDLTPGRLCAVLIKGEFSLQYYYPKGNRVRLASYREPCISVTFVASDVKVEAVVLRIDHVVWEHGVRKRRATAERPLPAKRQRRVNNSAEIARLQRQLDALRDEGEAWNESGMFRLERRIYDLMREATRDEWPDMIGEGGMR